MIHVSDATTMLQKVTIYLYLSVTYTIWLVPVQIASLKDKGYRFSGQAS